MERSLWGAAAVVAGVVGIGWLLPWLINAHTNLGLAEAALLLLLLGAFWVAVARALGFPFRKDDRR